MAASFVTTTVTQQVVDGVYQVYATLAIAPSALTYITGGIPMNLNQSNIKASRTPLQVNVFGSSGYIYVYVPGSDNSNGLLKIFVQGAAETDPLEEMANALAIPAGVSSDVINAVITYKGML